VSHEHSLDLFARERISPSAKSSRQPVNVAQVKKLSPFRYPGGKTWCVPEIRSWVTSLPRPKVFIEPFAGGGIASLTVAVENLADRVVMAELDADVATVWQTIVHGSDKDFEWLCRRIMQFEMTTDAARRVLGKSPTSTRELAFRTILKNRVNRGGIMAPGASLVKDGENGRGLLSRWYPTTLRERLRTIRSVRHKISFFQHDAFRVISRYQNAKGAAFFIDPPYTAGGKRAGTRLYVHNQIDHNKLFEVLSDIHGAFLATYDDASEVRALALEHGFFISTTPMKSTHHAVVNELLITRS
jgi:DNA adenine methylase